MALLQLVELERLAIVQQHLRCLAIEHRKLAELQAVVEQPLPNTQNSLVALLIAEAPDRPVREVVDEGRKVVE